MRSLLALVALLLVGSQEPGIEKGYTRPSNRVAGDKAIKICFLRTSFENDADPKVSRHSEDALNRVGKDLSSFFKIQSYGAMTVKAFEVTPVVKIGRSSDYERTTADGKEVPAKSRKPVIGDAIKAANLQLGRKLDKEFDFVCVVLNASPTKGRIAPTGVAAYATGPISSVFFAPNPNWRVFAHEIGHNFGFPHAWSLTTRGDESAVPKQTDRVLTEYGDPASPMGHGTNSYSLVEKYRMGWIGSSPSAARYVQKLEPGTLTFGAYDRASASGLVGGWLEGEFGLSATELISRRTPEEQREDPVAAPTGSKQRIWLSVVSRKNYADGAMEEGSGALLLAHLSSLPGKGGQTTKASTTVSLDLTPGKNARRPGPKDFGLQPGQTATVPTAGGKTLTLSFLKYDEATGQATVDAHF